VPKIVGKPIEYFYDTSRLVGYFCEGETTFGKRPGIVLVHDAFGVGDYMKWRADALAELGYAVLVADIGGEGAQPRKRARSGR